MIDADIGHLLRGLNGGADRALCLGHGFDLAEIDTAGPRGGCADHPEPGLPRHGADTVARGVANLVEPQHEAGNLGAAHIQDRNNTALHRGLAHVAHRSLGFVKHRHQFPVSTTQS